MCSFQANTLASGENRQRASVRMSHYLRDWQTIHPFADLSNPDATHSKKPVMPTSVVHNQSQPSAVSTPFIFVRTDWLLYVSDNMCVWSRMDNPVRTTQTGKCFILIHRDCHTHCVSLCNMFSFCPSLVFDNGVRGSLDTLETAGWEISFMYINKVFITVENVIDYSVNSDASGEERRSSTVWLFCLTTSAWRNR